MAHVSATYRLAVDFDQEGGWRAFSSSELHGRRLCEEEDGGRHDACYDWNLCLVERESKIEIWTWTIYLHHFHCDDPCKRSDIQPQKNAEEDETESNLFREIFFFRDTRQEK